MYQKVVAMSMVAGFLFTGAFADKILPQSGVATVAAAAAAPSEIQWQPWSDSAFKQAKAQHKLVILDLQAVWCHWCHVMDKETYRNPKIISQIQKNFVAIRVDQDSRPDLSSRYMEYGWPATIIFAPDGSELVKRAGYIEPQEMTTLLSKIVKDPTPEKDTDGGATTIQSFSTSASLPPALKASLLSDYVKDFDTQYGSWGRGEHKFLDADSVEYSIERAKKGDTQAAEMAKKTLEGQHNLLDPVWGGMYQYSTDGDWNHPHFERIMSIQTQNLRVYSEAYALWHDPLYLQTANAINHFLKTFLTSPEGAFYTSMDADVIQGKHSAAYFELNDKQRRQQGIPRIDKHSYARENGWAIHSLVTLYMATGDPSVLNQAKTAANWVIENRSLPNGGFRHNEKDLAGPYLGDTAAMGEAFLSLYQATGDRQWLTRAASAVGFVKDNFKNAKNDPGYVASASDKNRLEISQALRDDNIRMARLENNLYHVTGDAAYQALAEDTMRYLATSEIAEMPYSASVLLVSEELSQDPTHITVVGHKDDPASQALYQAALRYPVVYKRLDWWDKREGAMPNPDVQYPELDRPAAFVCTQNRCSLPVFQPTALAPLVDRLTQSHATSSQKPVE